MQWGLLRRGALQAWLLGAAITAHAQDTVRVREAQYLCTLSDRGPVQCLDLSEFASGGIVARALRRLEARPEGEVVELRCGEPPKGREKSVKRVSRRIANPRRRMPSRARMLDTHEWSYLAIERAEQNVLALLHACHATHHDLPDRVATGELPSGAPPRAEAEAELARWTPHAAPREPEPATGQHEVVIHPTVVRDADGLPLNPYDDPEADGVDPSAEQDGADTRAAQSLIAANRDPQLTEEERAEQQARLQDELDLEQYRPRPLPEDVLLMEGYDTVRRRVVQLVVRWREVEKSTLAQDACDDPLEMGIGCEL